MVRDNPKPQADPVFMMAPEATLTPFEFNNGRFTYGTNENYKLNT
jgi:hypothetical protein